MVLRLCIFFLSTMLVGLSFVHGQDSTLVEPVHLKINRVGDMTHIEVSGQKQWDYKLTKVEGGYSVLLPRISEQAIENLEGYSDLLVGSVTVDSRPGSKTNVILHLNDSGIENFDYLTQDPSNLIVDFFAKDEKLVKKLRKKYAQQLAGVNTRNIASVKPVAPKKAQVHKKKTVTKKIDRRPAFAEFLFTAEDVEAKPLGEEKISDIQEENFFDQQFDFSYINTNNDNSYSAKVIEAKGNIYLRFPILNLPNRHLKELEKYPPDYKIEESFSDENKQARFLQTLYNRKSFALFLKAKEKFKKNFPSSVYDEILNYMEGDTWVQLWKTSDQKSYLEKAIDTYKKITEKNPNSKLAERTHIYSAMLAHSKGRYFEAGKLLKRYLRTYPKSPFIEEMKIYMADTLAHLKNYEGALKLLGKLRKSDRPEISIEAQFRKADIYFLKKEYRKAEKNYQIALEKYPKAKEKFPNAWFNRAESLFNLAEYDQSLDSYKNFYEMYPTNEYSGFALTRIGELVDILSGDRKKAQGFYNESFYRFPASKGGAVAKMRSMSQRFPGMKENEIKYSIAEIKKLATEVDLEQIEEFSAFMISDGYYWRGQFQSAIETLIGYFQKDPNPVHMRKFERRISRAIAGEVRQLAIDEKPIQTLRVIQDHDKSWLSKSERIDVQYYRARSIELMGLHDKARKSYYRLLARMQKLEGSKEEKERKVFEYYPTKDQIYTRISATNFQSDLTDDLVQSLQQVEEPSKLESAEKIDYYSILSKLEFAKKNYVKAKDLIELVKDIPIVNKEKRDKHYVYLSSVYEKNKEFDKALGLLESYYKDSESRGEVDDIYVLSRLFHLYKSKNRVDQAIRTGEKLLAKYSNNNDLDKERYDLGELYFNQQNEKQAKKVWKDLGKKSVWKKIAKNKLETGAWQSRANKNIDRLPAMKQ